MGKSQPQSISAENTTTELIDWLDLRIGNKVEVEACVIGNQVKKKRKIQSSTWYLMFLVLEWYPKKIWESRGPVKQKIRELW